MQITPSLKSEFEEQISEFFRSRNQAEGEQALARHCNEMLKQLPDLLPLLKDYLVYGAMAFYGKMQILDKRLIASLAGCNTPAREAIQTLREKKALRIAASAKSGWDLLLEKNQEALWGIIQLNALAKPAIPDGPLARVDDDGEENDDELNEDDSDATDSYDDEGENDDDDFE